MVLRGSSDLVLSCHLSLDQSSEAAAQPRSKARGARTSSAGHLCAGAAAQHGKWCTECVLYPENAIHGTGDDLLVWFPAAAWLYETVVVAQQVLGRQARLMEGKNARVEERAAADEESYAAGLKTVEAGRLKLEQKAKLYEAVSKSGLSFPAHGLAHA